MNIRQLTRWETEKIPNTLFRIMSFLLKIFNYFYPAMSKAQKLGIQNGMTVVDYGCGPALYVKPVSDLIGEQGLLYALDVQELAMESVQKEIKRHNLKNVEAVLVNDYSCRLQNMIADLIYSVDVIHMVPQPNRYFKEMRRLIKPDGFLVIDSGHLPKEEARSRILQSGYWRIESENGRQYTCKAV